MLCVMVTLKISFTGHYIYKFVTFSMGLTLAMVTFTTEFVALVNEFTMFAIDLYGAKVVCN